MDVPALAKEQSQVATSRQLLATGMSRGQLETQLRAHRWQRHGQVIVLHNGPLTETQRLWVAVLQQPGRCGLAGLTAARAAGVRLYVGDETIHVLVSAHAHVRRRPGVSVHYSERIEIIRPKRQVPRVKTERAIVQAALWAPSPRIAAGYFLSAFQQRKVEAESVAEELRHVGNSRRASMLLALLGEARAGAGSLAEVEFARLARRAGLPAPSQQSRRVANGVIYLDFDFGGFCVEVDGPLHWDAASYEAGLVRQNALLRTGERLLRFSTVTIWSTPQAVIDELRSWWGQFGSGAPHERAS